MGKFWKWPTFFSVHRCREPRENVCMKNLSDFFFVLLLKMVFLFKLTLIELQDFWLHFSEASVFFFLICKSHWIFPRKLLTRKKKTFVGGPWEKLMENYYNCIGVSSIENWKMSSWIQAAPLEKLMEKTERFHARFSFSLLGLGPDWSDLPFSSFFSNIFRDSFTLEKVFPPRSFLSTLLHCLPTFIPTTQKIQMLWCNPKLQTSRGRL